MDVSLMREPMMSGWCSNPSESDGVSSHDRCAGGNTANPRHEFSPCPCVCHLDSEEYECECGGTIHEAPVLGEDEDGDPQYVHVVEVKGKGRRAVFGGCP